MIKLRSLVFGLLIALASPLAAFAQCSGNAPAQSYCGNATLSPSLPGWKPFSGAPFPNIAGGTVVGNRGTTSAAASAITNPILGIPGTSSGQIGFAGATSGTVTIVPQSTAGTPTLTLPNTTGTFAVGATLPVVLNATTGNLTCPTCVTSSGGGAITGTAPISVSAAGVVSINAPYVSLTASNGGIVYSGAANLAILNGTATAGQHLQSGSNAAPSWTTATYPSTAAAGTVLGAGSSNVITATATPTLGANGGTGGQITLSGATSGTAVIRVAAAAGTGTIFQLPPNNGSNTNILQTDGSGNTSWTSAGAGTVTSITCAATLTCTASNPITATGTIAINLANANAWTAAQTIQSSSANAFAVGLNGSTNPAFNVDASTASSATGITVKSSAAAGGVFITALSSGTNEGLGISSKGTGTLALQQTGTGAVTIGNAGSNAGALAFFNATSGSIQIQPTTGALGIRTVTMGAYSGSMGITIASGAKALATGAISSASCTSAQTDTATGTLTTDSIIATFAADPTSTTGYTAVTTGMLTIVAYPTADTVNFKVCNVTASSITPGAVTINWRVVR